jgi:hypothetical protein
MNKNTRISQSRSVCSRIPLAVVPKVLKVTWSAHDGAGMWASAAMLGIAGHQFATVCIAHGRAHCGCRFCNHSGLAMCNTWASGSSVLGTEGQGMVSAKL